MLQFYMLMLARKNTLYIGGLNEGSAHGEFFNIRLFNGVTYMENTFKLRFPFIWFKCDLSITSKYNCL